MKLNGTTITFKLLPPSCKFTDVAVANEDGTAFDVRWHCPDQAAGVEIKVAFCLARIHGKDTLMTANPENPTGISIYDRAARQLGKIEPIKMLAPIPTSARPMTTAATASEPSIPA